MKADEFIFDEKKGNYSVFLMKVVFQEGTSARRGQNGMEEGDIEG